MPALFIDAGDDSASPPARCSAGDVSAAAYSKSGEPHQASLLSAVKRAMAYRRKHGTPKVSTFEDFSSNFAIARDDASSESLAAQAIRDSAAHRDSSLSSAYGDSAFSSSVRDPMHQLLVSSNQTPVSHEYTSMSMNEKNTNKPKDGFWGVLARKAKSILEDDNVSQQFNDHSRNEAKMFDAETRSQFNQPNRSPENNRKAENRAYSLNYIGGTIRTALEEGLTIAENRTADIIHETKKLQIRRKSINFNPMSQIADFSTTKNLSQDHSEQQNQVKASGDAANAMAVKAKLLLRELKTLKADLAFAKERCSQLEEENKLLRESRQKGDNSEDDDLIRLQMETLLAEKGRLTHENSIYSRENRFLREIVEYHQLTMQQDLMYLSDHDDEYGAINIHQVLEADHDLNDNISSSSSPPPPQYIYSSSQYSAAFSTPHNYSPSSVHMIITTTTNAEEPPPLLTVEEEDTNIM